MNRFELVEKIVARHDISKAEAGRILNTVLEEVMEAVRKGDTLTLVGFGTFKLLKRPARNGRNPATGASIKIPATKLPKFIPGTAFKNLVNK